MSSPFGSKQMAISLQMVKASSNNLCTVKTYSTRSISCRFVVQGVVGIYGMLRTCCRRRFVVPHLQSRNVVDLLQTVDLLWICCGLVVQLSISCSIYVEKWFCCTACCTANPQLIEQVEFGVLPLYTRIARQKSCVIFCGQFRAVWRRCRLRSVVLIIWRSPGLHLSFQTANFSITSSNTESVSKRKTVFSLAVEDLVKKWRNRALCDAFLKFGMIIRQVMSFSKLIGYKLPDDPGSW